jgi:hypothetical protein
MGDARLFLVLYCRMAPHCESHFPEQLRSGRGPLRVRVLLARPLNSPQKKGEGVRRGANFPEGSGEAEPVL